MSALEERGPVTHADLIWPFIGPIACETFRRYHALDPLLNRDLTHPDTFAELFSDGEPERLDLSGLRKKTHGRGIFITEARDDLDARTLALVTTIVFGDRSGIRLHANIRSRIIRKRN